MNLVRRELRAMNSDITLICCQPDAARRLDRADRWLKAFEARFSRFQLLSELSRLNESTGSPFHASPALFRVVGVALEFARRSNGLFDPTILRRLEAAGYDRSFELIPHAGVRERPRTAGHGLSWRAVRLDATARTITLPAGAGLDLGGIGKGWAVDRLAAMLGSPCLVNGGGDVYVAGRPPAEAAWLVGVADPFRPEQDLFVLTAEDRGVATSSSLRRRWQLGDATLHHLIDPRTGRPSASDAVQVTAVAPSTVLADYHAKVALLLGVEDGREYLEREPEVDGLIVRSDGRAFESSGLARYRREQAI